MARYLRSIGRTCEVTVTGGRVLVAQSTSRGYDVYEAGRLIHTIQPVMDGCDVVWLVPGLGDEAPPPPRSIRAALRLVAQLRPASTSPTP